MAKKKGQGKLKRTSRGSVILPNGQRITPKEQKALRSAVNSANRKRKKLIEQLPDVASRNYKDFGVESDWVLRKKSTSLNRFRNKREFNAYLNAVTRLTKQDYIRKVIETYRSNFKRAVDNVFGSSGSELKKFVNKLSYSELRELTLSEEFNDIGYVYYDPIAPSKKLEVLTKQVEKIRTRNSSA